MTLTSQYIKFITDTQRRLENEEVRDIRPRIPNKLNSNIKLTNQPNNRPTVVQSSLLPITETHECTHCSLCVLHTQTYPHMTLMYGWQNRFLCTGHETLACCSWTNIFGAYYTLTVVVMWRLKVCKKRKEYILHTNVIHEDWVKSIFQLEATDMTLNVLN